MRLMEKTAKRIKRNLMILKNSGIRLSPPKMNLFLGLPVHELAFGLSLTFRSDFGDKFMYRHSMKAPNEMRELHRKFYAYLKGKKTDEKCWKICPPILKGDENARQGRS